MSLEVCPKCGADSIFLPLVPAAGYDGKLYGGSTAGFCNNPQCDQRLWYYPRSGRVTRRNSGMTYQEYRLRRVDVNVFNAMRRHAGLPPVVESPPDRLRLPAPDSPDPSTDSGEGIAGIEFNPRQYLFELWCRVRAFFVVYVPGFGRFSVSGDDE